VDRLINQENPMRKNFDNKAMPPSTKRIFFAGLCGGLAEMVWITFYSYLGPASGEEITRQITASIFPAAVDLSLAPLLGVGIHLILSLALSFAFVWTVWIPVIRRWGNPGILVGAVAALIVIWAVNFLIVLPVLNPAFVTLLPDSVTLFSKMLFGAAMALALQKTNWREQSHRIATSGNL